MYSPVAHIVSWKPFYLPSRWRNTKRTFISKLKSMFSLTDAIPELYPPVHSNGCCLLGGPKHPAQISSEPLKALVHGCGHPCVSLHQTPLSSSWTPRDGQCVLGAPSQRWRDQDETSQAKLPLQGREAGQGNPQGREGEPSRGAAHRDWRPARRLASPCGRKKPACLLQQEEGRNFLPSNKLSQ